MSKPTTDLPVPPLPGSGGSALVRPREIERFLRYYEVALEACDAKLGLFHLPGAATFTSRDIGVLARRAAEWAERKQHAYFHVHLHDVPGGEERHRGSIDSVRAAIGLFADIDARGPGRKKPAETLCPTVEDAVWLTEEFKRLYHPLRASLLMLSGHGCYPVVLFREPFLIITPNDRVQLEALSRRFHLALHRIAANRGWTGAVEFCDLAKVLRLPGCVNWKDPNKPMPVQVLYEDGARFNLGELNELLPQMEERGGLLLAGSSKQPNLAGGAMVLKPTAQVNPELLAALSEHHPLFAPTWDHKRDDLDDQSCSGYEMALADIGVACGLTDQQVADLLVVHRREFPGKKQHRRSQAHLKYLQRTISKARAGKQCSESAEREWTEFEARVQPADHSATEVQPAAEPRGHSADAGGGDQDGTEPAASAPEPESDATSDPEPGPSSSGPEPSDGAARQTTSEEHAQGDRAHRSRIPPSVEFLVAKVRTTGDFRLVYQHINLLGELSEADLAGVYQELKAALGSKLNSHHFHKAIKEVRGRQRHEAAKQAGQQQAAPEAPHPYREKNGGIIRLKEGKDGAQEVIPLTNFTARITSNIGEDDGVEVKRFFGIDAQLAGRPYSFIVPANRFASMDWPIENIGPKAIVHPNQKEWARAAIQSLSDQVQERRIYTHTGWRRVGDSLLYLHGGGAVGPNGAVPEVDVRLSGALVHYALVLPESRQQLIEAVRASLRVLDVAPDHITFAVEAAVYRACIKSCDFTVWLGGPTGVFKSELAALAQQHYGPAMNARRLPGNFASTGNALETLAFSTKDSLLVVDDFAPHGGSRDIARYHAAADRLLRAAGNNQGRGRLSSDARLREAKPPRGLILATGEDMPRGQSIRGRTLIIEVAPGDVRTEVLTECQAVAAGGTYARAMGGFIQWLAVQYEEIQAAFQTRVLELRSQATQAHARTPGIVADLHAGFELFLEFAATTGAITVAEKGALAERCWAALNRVAKAQQVEQESSEPTQRFLELLRAAILSGQAYVASLDGGAPGVDGQWGWQVVGSGDHERLVSRGKCIGWLDGGNLYLEPTASYGMAQELGRTTGEPLVVGQVTLKKRLKEKGLLVSVAARRETLTVRRAISGKSIPVLHLRSDALTADVGNVSGSRGNSNLTEDPDHPPATELFEC